MGAVEVGGAPGVGALGDLAAGEAFGLAGGGREVRGGDGIVEDDIAALDDASCRKTAGEQ